MSCARPAQSHNLSQFSRATSYFASQVAFDSHARFPFLPPSSVLCSAGTVAVRPTCQLRSPVPRARDGSAVLSLPVSHAAAFSLTVGVREAELSAARPRPPLPSCCSVPSRASPAPLSLVARSCSSRPALAPPGSSRTRRTRHVHHFSPLALATHASAPPRFLGTIARRLTYQLRSLPSPFRPAPHMSSALILRRPSLPR